MIQASLTPATRAQIKRLLPADLAADLQHESIPPEALARALVALRAHLEAILPLIPPPVARQHLQQPAPGAIRCDRWQGSLLFADLSGFTALSEQLSTLGREGSEVITGVINRLFAALTTEVTRFGGDLLKFGGDALTAFFPAQLLGDDHARLATAAALAMQEQMAAIGQVETRGGQHQLRLRTGVHSGSAYAAQLGDGDNMELLLTGSDVNYVARAQEVALPGEVVVTAETLALIGDAQSLDRGQGFYALSGFQAPEPHPVPPLPIPPQSGDLVELAAILDAIAALELFLPQGAAESGVIADERLASGFRLVTVLFAHVAPLSTILEQLPPSADAARLLNSYYRRMQQAVARFGGSVNKLDLAADGDKLLACFGAPLAQEHHQELAVRAALAMQAGLAEANAEIAELVPGLTTLHQEIGINTGHVFAGLVGTQARREYTVMGDVVNLAARLMAYADQGATWISSTTQRPLAHLFDCRPVPALTVKGKSAPVEPFAVAGAYETERARPEATDLRAAFVGRRHELEQMRELAGVALRGSGHTLVLTGEAGVGKSRMIEELLSWLTLRSLEAAAEVPPFVLLTTECQSYEQTVSFSSLRDLLLQLLRLPGPAGADAGELAQRLERSVNKLVPELARFAPLLGEVLGIPLSETPLTAALPPEQRRDRTHDLVSGLVGAAAQQHPLAIVWDDLHWCDASSLDALHALLQAVPRMPLLLIVGMRPDPALYRPIGEQVTLIHLRELDASAGAELVTRLLKGPAPPLLLEHLRTTDEGYNPFFVEELVRSLAESGTLVQRDDGWELIGDLSSLELPATIEDVIATRVDRLELRQRETLQEASVIGRRFLYPILSGIAEEQTALIQRLTALSTADLVLPEDDQAYLFKHMLTRDAVYASILYARRRKLHRRVAERIEELSGERPDEQLPLLARHYYAAEDWEQALRYSLAAGRRAQERYHNREALALFQMSLDSLSRLQAHPQVEAEAHECIGVAHFHLGEYHEAQGAFEKALATAQAQPLPDPNKLAQLYLHLARLAERRAELDKAFLYVQQGLQLIEGSDSPQLAPLLLMGAGLFQRLGRNAEAVEWAERSRAVAMRQHSRINLAHAYRVLCGNYKNIGQYRMAIEVGQASLQLFQEIGDLVGQSDAQMNLANVLAQLGRGSEAAHHFRSARRLKEELGDVYGQAVMTLNLGDLLYKIADYDGALQELRQALHQFERLGSQYATALVHMNIGAVNLAQGKLLQAGEQLVRSEELFTEIGANAFLAELYRYYAELALAEQQPKQALAYIERSLDQARQQQARAEEGASERTYGRILHMLGQGTEALRALRQAKSILEEVESHYELLGCLEDIARLSDDTEERAAAQSEIARKRNP